MKTHKVMTAIVLVMLAAACAGVETKPAGTKPVSFVTQPKTPDEQAVAQMLEAWIAAYNEPNLAKHVACYGPDAKIKSLAAGGVVSREEYMAALLSIIHLPKLELRQIKITMLSPDRSHVEADEHTFFASGSTDVNRHFFDLIRRDGQWYIIEERHLD